MRFTLDEERLLTSSALAGRADLRDGGPCHPDDLPEGYHAAARGQSFATSTSGGVEGCPRATARWAWLADTIAGRESLLLVGSNEAAARASARRPRGRLVLGEATASGCPSAG